MVLAGARKSGIRELGTLEILEKRPPENLSWKPFPWVFQVSRNHIFFSREIFFRDLWPIFSEKNGIFFPPIRMHLRNFGGQKWTSENFCKIAPYDLILPPNIFLEGIWSIWITLGPYWAKKNFWVFFSLGRGQLDIAKIFDFLDHFSEIFKWPNMVKNGS